MAGAIDDYMTQLERELSRRGMSLRIPRPAAKVEERRLRPERSEGLSDASRNPVT